VTLSRVMIALSERAAEMPTPDELANISRLAIELGVRLRPGSPAEGPAAVAIWLFDGSVSQLPGGFDTGELSPNSPVRVLQSFPQVGMPPCVPPVLLLLPPSARRVRPPARSSAARSSPPRPARFFP
jgi:aarF domain-containing kinase